jgi:Zn-dependent peptidase ImmA (M78 family)/transcriptional regulator with XRE-family HTH domain
VGFNGTNVRLARVLRDMTQLELANAVSASEATIWQTERDREPGDTLRDALAIVLKVDPEFFYDPIIEEFTEADCHFRKGKGSAERIRKRVLAQGTLFGHLVTYLQTRLKLPQYNVPELTGYTPQEIERAALACRAHWHLGPDRPITHMGRVLENAGVMLTRLRDDDAVKLDAFSRRGRNGGMSFVVLNPSKQSTSRTRYDMAHELAHLVFDHQEVGLPYDEKEKRADRFAAAFLLPEAGVRREFRFARGIVNWDHVFDLKQRWKVSAQAILYRALDLHLIDAVEFRRAYKTMSARRWIRDEPHEPPDESPELFLKAVRTLWQRKKLGADKIAADLHWTLETFEEVTGLRSSGPVAETTDVISLSDRRRLRA